jgi:hypothetical protein
VLLVLNIAFYSVILYSFEEINWVISSLLFIPIVMYNFISVITKMNKQYLFEIRFHH